MTQDEILIKLKSLGIIAVIGEDYLLTEKYKELIEGSTVVLQEVKTPSLDLNYKTLLDTSSNGSEWPIQLIDSKGFARATAFCDICDIPRFSIKGGYPLRGMSKDSINVLGNIMADDTICPATFIASVKVYYQYSEMPKSIKNLIIEGTIFEVYKEHIEGKLKGSLTGGVASKDNQTWR
jgi:hypothetical protein